MSAVSQHFACLLVHGLNGSPYDFHELADYLHTYDIATENVLLPGHDIPHEQAANFGWDDWLQAASERFDSLAQRYDRVAIVGHSMGGALALTIAEQNPRVCALVTLCAPVETRPGLLPLVEVGRHIFPYFPIFLEDIRDPIERRTYRRRKVTLWGAVAPLHTLLQALPDVRENLESVMCPTLIVAARNDHVVPARDGRYVFNHIGAPDKELLVLERSWHVVTRDVERHVVADRVAAFLTRVRKELMPPAIEAEN
jgi:carboxylesterase